jgi:signal peptidase I
VPEGTTSPGYRRLDRWARFRRWARSRRVVVRDGSMRPTLLPGDRLLVDPGAFRSRTPVPGDLVVLRDPEQPDRWLVKRVGQVAGEPLPDGTRVPEGTVYVRGDDAAESRDSRAFGTAPLALLVGRPWYRYLPPERRGPVGEDAS